MEISIITIGIAFFILVIIGGLFTIKEHTEYIKQDLKRIEQQLRTLTDIVNSTTIADKKQ